MREIKFRAWDTVKKVMYSAEELGIDQETLSPDGRGFINVNGISTKLSEYHTHLLPLEYTGLKDKNGKEIYEGDIVRYIIPEDEPVNIRTTGQIVWNPADAHFIFKRLDNDRVMFIHGEIVQIIGNIYENPELLEK